MAECRIDGRPVLDGPVEWALRSGTSPAQADFEMTPDDADALMGGGLSPVTLEFDGTKIENLYAIQRRPADNPHTAMVRLVDRRWFWKNRHIEFGMNVRRTVGYKRVSAGLSPPEIDPVTDDVAYAEWSLKDGYPWTAEEALKRIWDDVAKAEEEIGSRPSLEIELGSVGSALPIEDLMLHDPGDAALARILSYIPGAQITVRRDGTVHIYNQASGKDTEIFDAMPPEQEGGGHVEFVSYERIRPREVRVLFAPEVELRCDFSEQSTLETVSRAGGLSDRGVYMDNVLPVPDYSLAIKGSRTVAQGTWITVNDAINSWNPVPGFGNLSMNSVRRALVPFLDLWTGLRIAGLADAKNDWGSRVAALQTHFRRTYRIASEIVDRVSQIRAYRIGTIDPVTGTRAPAMAYQNWSVIATQRFLATRLAGGASSFEYATNFEQYPSDGKIGSDTIAAPVRVTVADQDQGILHLDMLIDPYRVHEQILPSKIINIPTGDLGPGGLVAWNAVPTGLTNVPQLAPSHKCSVILTVMPAAPNGRERLVEIVREPGDVSELLPQTLRGGLSDAKGPPLDVFVGPGWETARIPWVDERYEDIRSALGLGESISDAQGLSGMRTDKVKDLVMNYGDGQAIRNAKAASLDIIASSVAASVYAGFADRPEGSRTAPATHQAAIDGFIEQAVYRVMPSGESTVTVRAMEQVPPLSIEAFLPHSVRKLIFNLAMA